MKKQLEGGNPFRYGCVVEDSFYCPRPSLEKQLAGFIRSGQNVVIHGERRMGKTSLINAVVRGMRGWRMLYVDLLHVQTVGDVCRRIVSAVRNMERKASLFEKALKFLPRLRPVMKVDPSTGEFGFGLDARAAENPYAVEDVLDMLAKVAAGGRTVVVFDEFQDILNIRKRLDKQLRSIMQTQQNLNYILLGSQESMMIEIFERKKSPFYHFGQLMRLDKIPYEDFREYISARLPKDENDKLDGIIKEILSFTNFHPYYTQQLSAQVWEMMTYDHLYEGVVSEAISKIVRTHDLDFERLWLNFNRTDRSIMISLSKGVNPMQNRQMATSTSFSAIKRLMKAGYIIKVNDYEIEDPFFREWILRFCI